jgi:hypothetical protein
MSALSNNLDRLFLWLNSIGLQPPSLDVRIVEVHPCDVNQNDGKCSIRREDLHKPSDYKSRFDELLQAGYPWLNMSCYGLYDGLLIVTIEIPSQSVPRMTPSGWSDEQRVLYPGRDTSVNISGPARMVLDRGWNVDALLTIQ